MAGPGRLEELELSSEEAERLQRAFRDERFRALFAEYAATAGALFGQRVLWFNSLMKRVEY